MGVGIYFNFRERPRVRNFAHSHTKRLEEDWRL